MFRYLFIIIFLFCSFAKVFAEQKYVSVYEIIDKNSALCLDRGFRTIHVKGDFSNIHSGDSLDIEVEFDGVIRNKGRNIRSYRIIKVNKLY